VAERRYKKLTINVAAEVYDELQKMAEERDLTVTDLVKRAIALDRFVWENRDGELLIKDKDSDTVRQIVLLR
jgi:predicted CopG family antitoxin